MAETSAQRRADVSIDKIGFSRLFEIVAQIIGAKLTGIGIRGTGRDGDRVRRRVGYVDRDAFEEELRAEMLPLPCESHHHPTPIMSTYCVFVNFFSRSIRQTPVRKVIHRQESDQRINPSSPVLFSNWSWGRHARVCRQGFYAHDEGRRPGAIWIND